MPALTVRVLGPGSRTCACVSLDGEATAGCGTGSALPGGGVATTYEWAHSQQAEGTAVTPHSTWPQGSDAKAAGTSDAVGKYARRRLSPAIPLQPWPADATPRHTSHATSYPTHAIPSPPPAGWVYLIRSSSTSSICRLRLSPYRLTPPRPLTVMGCQLAAPPRSRCSQYTRLPCRDSAMATSCAVVHRTRATAGPSEAASSAALPAPGPVVPAAPCACWLRGEAAVAAAAAVVAASAAAATRSGAGRAVWGLCSRPGSSSSARDCEEAKRVLNTANSVCWSRTNWA